MVSSEDSGVFAWRPQVPWLGGGVSSLVREETDQERVDLGLRHVLWVFTRPVQLFSRLEDTAAYGWALVVLLGLMLLLGYAEVKTGLIDRTVDRETEQKLAELEKLQLHLVDRMEFKEQMEEIRKSGEFTKLIRRLRAIVLSPLYILASFLITASVLYAAVALIGRKPEYHTLMGICVYAGFFGLLATALRFAMVIGYRTVDVDTSLAMLAEPGKPTWLAAADPFCIWFWVLVAIGVCVTQQLTRRTAIVTCSLMCLAGLGGRVALQYAGV